MLDKLISLSHILGWAGIKFAPNQGGTSLPGSLAGDYWKCKSGCNSRNFAVCGDGNSAAGNFYVFLLQILCRQIGGAAGGLWALTVNDVCRDTVHWVCFDFPFSNNFYLWKL